MIEIKAFQDGKDFVVIFKNCNPSVKQMIEGLLAPMQEIEDSNLEPTPAIADDVVINFSKYKNISASDILREEGAAGYANLRWMLDNEKIPSEDESALREILSQYFLETMHSIEEPYKWVASKSREDCTKILKCYSDHLSEDMQKKASEQAGFVDYESFINNASDELIRSFTAAFIEKSRTY